MDGVPFRGAAALVRPTQAKANSGAVFAFSRGRRATRLWRVAGAVSGSNDRVVVRQALAAACLGEVETPSRSAILTSR